MNDKIMSGGNLEDIMLRLDCCRTLLGIIHEKMDGRYGVEDALYGAIDLLRCICRDFQADIDAAEDYTGKGAKA